ncbi:GNAT family N-acetyltransferase [Snuella sedimenti]|uniref:GNAT family N-acetyltransferase n=1 Tax=Snuella sedimenti TaxID=2798802 RepID=A0A8J7LMH6_9FLAO|nr:GNAT family protein [Snuella sedimenti]MBJ6367554.1 GNAT family N-acetyltransferase [Snuella sedimenti]
MMPKIVKLQSFEKRDFERLINWVADEYMLVQFAGSIFKFPLTEKELNTYVDNKEILAFKVIEEHTNLVIGHAEISPSEDVDTVKICRVLIGDKENRGKGYGKRIIYQLLNIAFYELKKEKAELNVFDWNVGAIKCYEQLGFIRNPNKDSFMMVKEEKWKSLNMIMKKDYWKTKSYTFNF